MVAGSSLDDGFRPLSQGALVYPSRARRLHVGGEARLEIEIEPDGRVRVLRVLSESGNWGFGRAARRAFEHARFTPPTVNGRPVRVRWRKTLRFQP